MRTALLDWLRAQAGPIVQGYYLDSEEGQPDPSHLYCSKHARRGARLLTRLSGVATEHYECWSGDDCVERCHICDVSLDTGGLSSSGVDDILREEVPPDVGTYGEEFRMAAYAMVESDPRWALWERIVAEMRQAVESR